jgi:hypothetical protein
VGGPLVGKPTIGGRFIKGGLWPLRGAFAFLP